MSVKIEIQPQHERELVICRLINAPREKVFRAWTDPKILPLWFAPRPWSTARVEIDPRTGGNSLVVMKSPEGQEMPCPGVYLEVIPHQKIVFTDAFTKAWEPSAKPFFTGVLTFEDQGGKTRYTARALHWTVEDCKQHEQMGFHNGWAQCADQLEEAVSKL